MLCSSEVYVNLSKPYYKRRPHKDQATQYKPSDTPVYVKPSEIRTACSNFAKNSSMYGIIYVDQANK